MNENASYGPIWVMDVPTPDSKYYHESDSVYFELVEKGHIIGKPKGNKKCSAEEFERKKFVGLYRPRNWMDDTIDYIKRFLKIP